LKTLFRRLEDFEDAFPKALRILHAKMKDDENYSDANEISDYVYFNNEEWILFCEYGPNIWHAECVPIERIIEYFHQVADVVDLKMDV
jgi:hypothetical protein